MNEYRNAVERVLREWFFILIDMPDEDWEAAAREVLDSIGIDPIDALKSERMTGMIATYLQDFCGVQSRKAACVFAEMLQQDIAENLVEEEGDHDE